MIEHKRMLVRAAFRHREPNGTRSMGSLACSVLTTLLGGNILDGGVEQALNDANEPRLDAALEYLGTHGYLRHWEEVKSPRTKPDYKDLVQLLKSMLYAYKSLCELTGKEEFLKSKASTFNHVERVLKTIGEET